MDTSPIPTTTAQTTTPASRPPRRRPLLFAFTLGALTLIACDSGTTASPDTAGTTAPAISSVPPSEDAASDTTTTTTTTTTPTSTSVPEVPKQDAARDDDPMVADNPNQNLDISDVEGTVEETVDDDRLVDLPEYDFDPADRPFEYYPSAGIPAHDVADWETQADGSYLVAPFPRRADQPAWEWGEFLWPALLDTTHLSGGDNPGQALEVIDYSPIELALGDPANSDISPRLFETIRSQIANQLESELREWGYLEPRATVFPALHPTDPKAVIVRVVYSYERGRVDPYPGAESYRMVVVKWNGEYVYVNGTEAR